MVIKKSFNDRSQRFTYAAVPELMLGLTKYFMFYNEEHPHQGLGYQTPNSGKNIIRQIYQQRREHYKHDF